MVLRGVSLGVKPRPLFTPYCERGYLVLKSQCIYLSPAHAAFRELAAEQTRCEMIPSARGMAFPYKVGYSVRLRRILERVAVAILRANELQIRMFMRDCVSKVACGAGGIG